jgi:hypothetical protein
VDLALVETAALLEELYARYDCAVFAGLRVLDADREEAEFGYCGGTYAGEALANALGDYVQAQRHFRALAAEDLEGEDDDAEGC